MRILFICTHNRCRSILAEAVTKHLAADRIVAASAGSEPAGAVHPLSIKYLKARGIPTSDLQSESWDLYANFQPDVVITLCDSAAKESCPVWFSSAAMLHWGLPDPSLEKTNGDSSKVAFENTIDILEKRINSLLSLPFEQFSMQERIDCLNQLAL